jgi:outer membrane scaffolding protein for murein synthesis (MipA/OmpV family)
VDGLTRNPRRKDRALPQIGRDVVKIGGMDGVATFRRAGDIRARFNAKQGTADERHDI